MKALLIVDVQNDFLPGGSLGIEGADLSVAVINCLQKEFDLVVATKDWHPQDHISFASTHGKKVGESIYVEGILQKLWPVHCVQGTSGADFPATLETSRIQKVLYKGSEREIDSYSAFFDNARLKETALRQYLEEHQVNEIYIVGLATDFCVKYSALDAIELGFAVTVVEDGCRGIEKGRKALEEMKRAGARVITSGAI